MVTLDYILGVEIFCYKFVIFVFVLFLPSNGTYRVECEMLPVSVCVCM